MHPGIKSGVTRVVDRLLSRMRSEIRTSVTRSEIKMVQLAARLSSQALGGAPSRDARVQIMPIRSQIVPMTRTALRRGLGETDMSGLLQILHRNLWKILAATLLSLILADR